MSVYIGLDIGGTKLLVGAARKDGSLISTIEQPTPRLLSEGLNALHQMAREVAGGEPIIAFGAAAGGPLDYRTGRISPLHQPEWNDVPLKDIFEQEFGVPLAVDVDTNVAALGEYKFGQKAHVARLMYVTISTGLGGGFLIEGQIYRGTRGEHPEVGHQSIPVQCRFPERVVCECGASNCLEALISGNGIRRIYRKPAEKLGADEWNEVAYHLGQGLRNIAVMYTPDTIVLGGGVAVGGGESFIAKAVSVMQSELKLVPAPIVALTDLGSQTALMGAIALAMAMR
jgi:predicted NBD/HSP70 family sugar kinase